MDDDINNFCNFTCTEGGDEISDMEKEFSDGFIKDLMDLFEACIANDTNSVNLSTEVDDVAVSIDITFSAKTIRRK